MHDAGAPFRFADQVGNLVSRLAHIDRRDAPFVLDEDPGRVVGNESQSALAGVLTASRRMSRVQSDERAGASPKDRTRAPRQGVGDSRGLTLSAKAKQIDKIAFSRDDVRAKALPDDQRSTTRTDSPATLPSKVDGRSPESRKRTIMARYVFGDELKPGERWKRRLLRSR